MLVIALCKRLAISSWRHIIIIKMIMIVSVVFYTDLGESLVTTRPVTSVETSGCAMCTPETSVARNSPTAVPSHCLLLVDSTPRYTWPKPMHSNSKTT